MRVDRLYTALMKSAAGLALFLFFVAGSGVVTTTAEPPDWSRFRGPNGSGISSATRVPPEFGPEKNLFWRLQLPQGHSSPILYAIASTSRPIVATRS